MFGAIGRLTKKLADRVYTVATGRSPKWPKLRAEWLEDNPQCAVTGDRDDVEAHHIVPVHVDATLELDRTNLITLRRDMHLFVGHLNNWKSWNPSVVNDAEAWRKKIRFRPRKAK